MEREKAMQTRIWKRRTDKSRTLPRQIVTLTTPLENVWRKTKPDQEVQTASLWGAPNKTVAQQRSEMQVWTIMKIMVAWGALGGPRNPYFRYLASAIASMSLTQGTRKNDQKEKVKNRMCRIVLFSKAGEDSHIASVS